MNIVKLSVALRNHEKESGSFIQGSTDIWSGLGQVFLKSVNAWVPADPNLMLKIGEEVVFKDRFDNKTTFVVQ
jgi:hypothetical protein